MKNINQPAIVVAAYNRKHSLSRLLSSLDRAKIPGDTTLIVSIDNNGTNQDVVGVANDFNWKHGKKEVIHHEKRLGLKNHILKCGGLSEEFGSVIVLEDDLYVSPFFYDYATKAVEFYQDDEKIAGISLYNQPYTESVKLPFQPLKEDSDVYFMQIASSYGQLWTSAQWEGFRRWMDTSPVLDELDGLPMLIKKWPETSWKKHYCGYLVATDKYFVFPQLSYTTNFSDPGSNFLYRNHFGQVQIDLFNQNPRFKSVKDALNVYDSYSEILPEKLVEIAPVLKKFDFEVDLYGKKEKFVKQFALTCKPCKRSMLSFERSMKPHELNIVFNIEGNDFFLTETKEILYYPRDIKDLLFNVDMKAFIEEFGYYFRPMFRSKILLHIILVRIKYSLMRMTSKR